MEKQNFTTKLKFLISENEEEKVFEFLNQNFISYDNYNEIVLLTNRFKKYKNEKRLGILKNEESVRNSIILSLLQILTEIDREFDVQKVKDDNFVILEKAVKKVENEKLINTILNSIYSLGVLGVAYLFYLGFGIGIGIVVGIFLIVLILYYYKFFES